MIMNSFSSIKFTKQMIVFQLIIFVFFLTSCGGSNFSDQGESNDNFPSTGGDNDFSGDDAPRAEDNGFSGDDAPRAQEKGDDGYEEKTGKCYFGGDNIDLNDQPNQKNSFPAAAEVVSGQVEVQLSREGAWEPLSGSCFINTGDSVRTIGDSSAVIFFKDSSRILLGPHTVVSLEQYTSNTDYRIVKLNVNQGVVTYNIVSSGEGLSTFQLVSPGAVVSVQGAGGTVEGQFLFDPINMVVANTLFFAERGEIIFGQVTQNVEGFPTILLTSQETDTYIVGGLSDQVTDNEVTHLTDLMVILTFNGGQEVVKTLEQTGNVESALVVVASETGKHLAGKPKDDIDNILKGMAGGTDYEVNQSASVWDDTDIVHLDAGQFANELKTEWVLTLTNESGFQDITWTYFKNESLEASGNELKDVTDLPDQVQGVVNNWVTSESPDKESFTQVDGFESVITGQPSSFVDQNEDFRTLAPQGQDLDTLDSLTPPDDFTE